METYFRVEDFFNITSWGPTIVLKWANLNNVLSHGVVLKTEEGSKWKITGVSSTSIKHSESPCGKDQIMISYKLEHLSGDKSLKKGDRLFIEQN